MNILEKIIEFKRKQVDDRKRAIQASALERTNLFRRQPFSLTDFIRDPGKTGVIAEFKRKSPSKGVINANASVAETTQAYAAAGASGLSVLTDEEFFGGSSDDLILARANNECPILRKDFIVDEYQIIEAKSIGADVILLIAATLDPGESKQFADVAHGLGLQVLLEVHSEEELRANLGIGADLIGVNNRNLKTFEVDLGISKTLSPLIPEGVVRVSESGISDPASIAELRRHGFEGFLIGENFMKESDPGAAAARFMEALRETNE